LEQGTDQKGQRGLALTARVYEDYDKDLKNRHGAPQKSEEKRVSKKEGLAGSAAASLHGNLASLGPDGSKSFEEEFGSLPTGDVACVEDMRGRRPATSVLGVTAWAIALGSLAFTNCKSTCLRFATRFSAAVKPV
jgi:hypothetical protein